MIGERELQTLVLGLTHVAVLEVVTGTLYGECDEQVFRGVDVSLDCTIQFSTQQGEVQTDVTGDGGLPLQVGVSHVL